MPSEGRGLGHRVRSLRSNHPTLLWFTAGAMAAILLVGVYSGVTLLSIASDLRRAQTMIESAGVEIQDGRLAEAREHLASAERLLIGANDQLYGRPQFDLIGWLPVVDKNLSSLRSSVGLALQMVQGGNELLQLTRPLENAEGRLEVSLQQGAIPLATVQAAERRARDLAAVLPAASEVPDQGFVVSTLADLQTKLYTEAGRRREQLDNVSRALGLLADMAGGNGDRRYLIAVANPAEMRGAGGMILSYGVLESSEGTFTLGEFGNIDELALDPETDVGSFGVPDDFLTRWEGLQPTVLWRNTTLAPDFRLAAPVMERMFTAKTELSVDGVIQIDPAGLAAILKGTGPISVESVGEVTAENVVDLTINQAYIDFPDRDQRQEVLGDVAEAAFDTLINGQFSSLRPFGEALFQAAAGRHLIFFANDAGVGHDTSFFGVDGAVPPADTQDYAMLTVQNFGKNKLDYYLDTALTLTGQRQGRASGRVDAEIMVANTTPPDITSEYITGPTTSARTYALYQGVVSLYLPNGTRLAGAEGTDSAVTLTTEAGRTVATFEVALLPGESSVVTLHLELVPRAPDAPYALTLVPVGRVRPTVVAVDLDLGDGVRVRRSAAPLERPTVVAPVQALPPE